MKSSSKYFNSKYEEADNDYQSHNLNLKEIDDNISVSQLTTNFQKSIFFCCLENKQDNEISSQVTQEESKEAESELEDIVKNYNKKYHTCVNNIEEILDYHESITDKSTTSEDSYEEIIIENIFDRKEGNNNVKIDFLKHKREFKNEKTVNDDDCNSL